MPAGSLSGSAVNVAPGHEPARRGQSSGSTPTFRYVAAIARTKPEVLYTYTTIGGQSEAVDAGNVFVKLQPKAERDRTQQQVEAEVRRPGGVEPDGGHVVARGGSVTYEIYPLHQPAVFAPGTRPEDVDTSETEPIPAFPVLDRIVIELAQEVRVFHGDLSVDLQARVRPAANPFAVMQVRPVGRTVARVRFVITAAGADRPRPAGRL